MLVIRQAETSTLRFDADCDACGVGVYIAVALTARDAFDKSGYRVEGIVRRAARKLTAAAREHGCRCPVEPVRRVSW
jgi:hypothetical protein